MLDRHHLADGAPASGSAAGSGLRFRATSLHGAWLIESAPAHDERGFFERTFCVSAFAERGLVTEFVQHSVSHSKAAGTLRGMHFQKAPHGEAKVVGCRKGAFWDVIIDLRPDSSTFMRWEGFHLTVENRRQLYVPVGFAHGFQTLVPETEAGYLISAFYAPEAASGVRHDDPAFGISWPLPIAAISDKDRQWPDFRPG